MNPQIPFFINFFIKNESHGTIHTFKNYFTTVFLVFSFSKISFIQTDHLSKKWVDIFPPISNIIKINGYSKDIGLKNIFKNFFIEKNNNFFYSFINFL